MEELIGFSEVTAALIFSFGFALLLECLLLRYLLHVIALGTVQPKTEQTPQEVAMGLRHASEL